MEPDRGSRPLGDRAGERGYDLPQEPDMISKRNAAMAYLLAGFTGLLMLVWKREDRFVQFHSLQSIAGTVVAIAIAMVLRLLSFFPLLGFLYGMLLHLFQFGLFFFWLFLLWQAFIGRWYRIPYVGAWAQRQVL